MKVRATILGFAAATPLGYSLEATLAAMGADLSVFSDSPARALSGEPAPASCLIDPTLPAAERLVRLFAHGLADLLALLGPLGIERPPVLLGMPAHLDAGTLARLDTLLHDRGLDAPANARFAYGRASTFAAMSHAVKLLHGGGHPCVVVGGVDSLCAPATIEALAHARRVLEPFTEGTVPGEAATFVVLAPADAPALDPDRGLWLEDVAVGRGPSFLEATTVNADALTQVLHRLAGNSAGRAHRVVAAHSGEGYFARSFSLACLRAVDLMPEPLQVALTADKVGDIGAAAGPLGLAFAAYQMANDLRQEPAPRRAIVYTESDGGEVGAALLHGQPRSWRRASLLQGD